MSAARVKGTRWESVIVCYLRDNGAPHAERRALNGANDKGDITGIPGLVIEAKNVASARLGEWVDEANIEADRAGAAVGVVWHHRRGHSGAGRGFVTMDGDTFVKLLHDGGYLGPAD